MAAVRSIVVPDMLITTYLQMTRRDQFRPTYIERGDVAMQQVSNPDTSFYKKLYTGVGQEIRWRDRLLMPESELKAALNQPGTSLYVMYVGGNPAGYVEIVHNSREAEIAYFGLFPTYHGMGLGKHLLSFGIQKAWEQPVERVWLHTCNLDSPHALDNYLKRGFQIYKIHRQPMPEKYQ